MGRFNEQYQTKLVRFTWLENERAWWSNEISIGREYLLISSTLFSTSPWQKQRNRVNDLTKRRNRKQNVN